MLEGSWKRLPRKCIESEPNTVTVQAGLLLFCLSRPGVGIWSYLGPVVKTSLGSESGCWYLPTEAE